MNPDENTPETAPNAPESTQARKPYPKRDLSPEEIERDLVAFLRANGNEARKSAITLNVGGGSKARSVVLADMAARGLVELATQRGPGRGRPATVVRLIS